MYRVRPVTGPDEQWDGKSILNTENDAGKMKPVTRQTHRLPAWLSLAVMACVMLVPPPAWGLTAVQLTTPDEGTPGPLVSVDWLAEHLQDSSIVLLHVGMPTARASGEFIPGARFLNYQEIVQVRDSLIVEMPTIDELIEPLEVAGVSDGAMIILYGNPAHLPARAYVTLDYLGLGAQTAVLDGGLEAWKATEHPVVAIPAQGPRGLFTPIVRDDVLVSAEWIEERLYDPTVALIDSRPEGEYNGSVPIRIGGRAGHIPGARNLYWEDLLVAPENPVLLDFTDVQLQFVNAGADYGAIVVNYCYVGMRASYTYLIAKHLGYDARLYDGSWNEWSKNDSLPAVTSPQP
jgi:thiosulfate/3-mercaptopyruvate sulfurtransferase